LTITSYQSHHELNKKKTKTKKTQICVKGVPEPTMQSNEIELVEKIFKEYKIKVSKSL